MKKTPIIAQRFFGLHMVEGPAEYRAPDKTPKRILVLANAIAKMDRTFEGRPVYVDHVDEVEVKRIPEDADGHVVKSFRNSADGKHWVEFLVTTQEGLDALRRGWKLSNAYTPTSKTIGGMWHGLDYDEEVTDGAYDHLAIVENPRYAESKVLTPDEFKLYNAKQEQELTRLANSKDKIKGAPMFKIFKREKVENTLDMENMVIELPTSKKEVTLAKLVNDADKLENAHGYCNEDHLVKVGEEEMSVKQMKNKYSAMMKKNADEEEEKKKNAEAEGKEGEEKKENEDEEKKDEEKKKNALDEQAKSDKEAADKKAEFEKLANAHLNAPAPAVKTIDLDSDKAARGKSRYGSK